MKFIDQLPLSVLLLIALTLGLAPFSPQPHVVEKLAMLFNGELSKPIDIFDLLMHGQCSVFSVQCSVFSVQCSVFSVQCSVFSVQCSDDFSFY